MGVNSEIQAAFAEAGEVLAKVTGMADTAETNTLIAGRKYLGIFGPPQLDRIPIIGGGFRQRTWLNWTAIRTQFAEPPAVGTELVRIDTDPHLKYRIERVFQHDPIHYIAVLVRVGEQTS